MTFDKAGEIDVRKEMVDGILRGFAKRMYKLKNYVLVDNTGAWTNYFWRASPDTLEAGTTRNVKGLARGAAFPQASTSFEKIRTDIEKYGLEDSIAWEDIISGAVSIRDQTLMRIAEGVVYSEDSSIYSGLTGASGIQTLSISVPWDLSSASILDDLEAMEEKIANYNYPTDNLIVFVNQRDKRSVMNWLFTKGAQIPNIADKKINAGVIGTLGNKTFVVSPVVTTSSCLMMVPNKSIWKELVPLQTDVRVEPLKDVRIRAATYGVLQVTDPKTIVNATGTLSA